MAAIAAAVTILMDEGVELIFGIHGAGEFGEDLEAKNKKATLKRADNF
jgi:hypothetical protein